VVFVVIFVGLLQLYFGSVRFTSERLTEVFPLNDNPPRGEVSHDTPHLSASPADFVSTQFSL
jgi:hypothetical protein